MTSIVYANAANEVLTAFGYGYDAAGNQTHKQFADGSQERYGYDGLDRLTAVDYPSGRRVEYGYDAVGNRRELVDSTKAGAVRWPQSARSSGSNTNAWAVGAPDGVSWSPSAGTPTPHWLELSYGQAERAKGVRIHEMLGAPSVGRVDLIEENGTTHTVYEGGDGTTRDGWLAVSFSPTSYAVKRVRVWTVKGPGVANGEEIESVGLEPASVETYGYNAFNQLTTVTGVDGAVTSFGYDENGNQVRKQDGAGVTQYVYNEDNRLVGIALPGGVSNAFEYDANGLRTKKTDSSGTTSYLLDGMSVVAQYAPDGARQAWYTQSLARIDEVLSVVNGQGKYWYQSDALGSTYAMANGAGAVVARGGYDVFGEPVAVSGNVGQPFGFTGREHERDSGLVYARARYLSTTAGRWTATDPLGFVAGPNFYRYVRNDPANLFDPDGLSAAPAIPPSPVYPPAANEPMRPVPVFDTLTAYAVYHPLAFLALMMDLGFIAGEIYATVARDCDENNDSLQQFWRGDSSSRAWASVTGGFIAAGIGTQLGQLGYGLYMSGERSVAVRYAIRTPKEYRPGAVLEILIRTSLWKAVMAMGAVDGVPIAAEDGTQSFVPTGPALELFDEASYKIIEEEL